MTMPILTSSPTLAHGSPTKQSASENSTDSSFSDLLSTRRQSLDAQSSEQELSVKQGLNNKQQEPEDDAEALSLKLALPELALAIAVQAASLRQTADTAPQTNSPTARKSLNGTASLGTTSRILGNEANLSSLVSQPTHSQNEGISNSPATKLQDALLGGAAQARTNEQAQQQAPGATKLVRNALSLDANMAAGRNVAERHNQVGTQANAARTDTISNAVANLSAQTENSFSAIMGTEQHSREPLTNMQPGISITPMQPAVSTGINALPSIGVQLQHPHWPQAMSQQFMQLLPMNGKQETQIAELRLDPPELGPLRISIQISDNVAHAMFVSAHASVRQALEQAMPQLQEQLEQAGLSLGQTSVSDQNSQQTDFAQQQENQQTRTSLASSSTGSNVESHAETPQRVVSSNALVDTFA